MANEVPLLEVAPQPYAWTSRTTDCGYPQYVKIFSYLTVLAPVQPGQLASIVLTVDPGLGTQRIITAVFDLSGTGVASTINGQPYQNAAGDPLDLMVLHTTTVGDTAGGEIRGYLANLSVQVNVPPGQRAPQVWKVTVWGIPTSPLAVRT